MPDNEYCLCLVFLDGQSAGRVERYPGCPRHWRLVGDIDAAAIDRHNAPVPNPDRFLDDALT